MNWHSYVLVSPGAPISGATRQSATAQAGQAAGAVQVTTLRSLDVLAWQAGRSPGSLYKTSVQLYDRVYGHDEHQ